MLEGDRDCSMLQWPKVVTIPQFSCQVLTSYSQLPPSQLLMDHKSPNLKNPRLDRVSQQRCVLCWVFSIESSVVGIDWGKALDQPNYHLRWRANCQMWEPQQWKLETNWMTFKNLPWGEGQRRWVRWEVHLTAMVTNGGRANLVLVLCTRPC